MVYLMDFNLLWISIPATVCTTTASIPQIIYARAGLSRITITVRFVGCILWSVYGALRQEYALCVCSVIAASIELTLGVKTFLCPTALNDTVSSPNDALTDHSTLERRHTPSEQRHAEQ